MMIFVKVFRFMIVIQLFSACNTNTVDSEPFSSLNQSEVTPHPSEVRKLKEKEDAWKFWVQSKCWMMKIMKYTAIDTENVKENELCNPEVYSDNGHANEKTGGFDFTNISFITAIVGISAAFSQMVVLLMFIAYMRHRSNDKGGNGNVKATSGEVDIYQCLPELPPDAARRSRSFSIGIGNNGKENIYATACVAEETAEECGKDTIITKVETEPALQHGRVLDGLESKHMSAPPEYSSVDRSERKLGNHAHFLDRTPTKNLPDHLLNQPNGAAKDTNLGLLPDPVRTKSLPPIRSEKQNNKSQNVTIEEADLSRRPCVDPVEDLRREQPCPPETSTPHLTDEENYSYADLPDSIPSCNNLSEPCSPTNEGMKEEYGNGYTDMSRNASFNTGGPSLENDGYEYVQGKDSETDTKMSGYEQMDGIQRNPNVIEKTGSGNEYVKMKSCADKDGLY